MTEHTKSLLAQMTEEEKIGLVTGADFFSTRGIPRLGIPPLLLSDGPHGVRAQEQDNSDHLGLNASAAATCFPSGAAMASGWNPDITAAVGKAIGEEARGHGIRVILGPALNLKRSPLCGRNFEYYSEDPYLSGKLAAAYIQSLQSTGVAACPKHFACNNQEDRRMVSNSVVEERALRELYLAGFELAVREGRPWSVMCAYNKVNGVFCSENRRLLTDILRDEWGFDGAVISDWGAVSNKGNAVAAGMDLEMPGTGGFSDTQLRQALADGSLSPEALDACVSNLLALMERTTSATPLNAIDFEGHHALAQRAAEECLILLKNEAHTLPLRKSGQIAVLGALAQHPRYQGGGSSHVASWKVDNTLEQLRATAPQAELSYAPGYHLSDGGRVDESLLEEAVRLAQTADAAVLLIGLTEQYETEGADRRDMRLPAAHNELVERITAVNPNVTVVLTAGAPVELPWLDKVQALVSTYTAGDGLGCALARILFGDVNPSGKLAETMPIRLEHNPSYLNFRESKTDIRYAEGVFVGYRWYDSRKLPVAFPFGHGLSYTSFAYSNLQVDQTEITENDTLTVSLQVTNTGTYPGKECVQLYVADVASSLPRPVQELKGFAKPELQPGETKTISFSLDRRAFAFYDAQAEAWAVEPGEFELRIGASSADIRLKTTVSVQAAPWNPLRRVTQETTFGELVDHPATYPLICAFLRSSPMYRPEEMPDAPDFLRNLPLWTLNHMSGHPITPEQLREMIGQLNRALETHRSEH